MSAPATMPATGGCWMVCAACELAGGPYPSRAETAALAGVHDRLHHGGRPTGAVAQDPACESCRQAPAVATWSHPGAGAPFLLCAGCTPADGSVPARSGGEG